ncbi:MAG: phosphoglycerate kinase [Alphaproteobacteria bacterium]|nr:phosphoglycerate kinase [Alphaproteobacteria bacterium]
MRDFLTLDDIDCHGKTVLLRADLNVPVDEAGTVTDATRLERLAPTIRDLAACGARIAVLSHFGRPKGKPEPGSSLRQITPAFARALGRDVSFAEDCIGAAAQAAIGALGPGGVAVLENTRFHAGETANDPAFTAQLAKNGDIFVMDAFSTAHRAHASTVGLAELLPAAAGRLMQAELDALDAALEHPARPVLALVGGAKISTKLDLLGNLVARVDVLVLGGGMANTFLAARGVDVGQSLYERDMLDTAREIDAAAAKKGCAILLPTDAVVAAELRENAVTAVAAVGALPAGQKIFDIGPQTVGAICAKLTEMKTVVWNGPLGVFEIPPFDAGTCAVANMAGDLTGAGKIISVAGGGDTVAALNVAGQAEKFTYISTAGGAFLEWLEGKDLPAVAALREAKRAQTAKR